MRNLSNRSKAANIVLAVFLTFQKSNVVICSSPIFTEAPEAVICSISNLPKAATKDQRIERPEDQGTSGPGALTHN